LAFGWDLQILAFGFQMMIIQIILLANDPNFSNAPLSLGRYPTLSHWFTLNTPSHWRRCKQGFQIWRIIYPELAGTERFLICWGSSSQIKSVGKGCWHWAVQSQPTLWWWWLMSKSENLLTWHDLLSTCPFMIGLPKLMVPYPGG
jgi:hypothetical protein